MKYIVFFWTIIFVGFLSAENRYIEQIKIVDQCTHLTEPLTIHNLGIKGTLYKKLDEFKAVRACEKSLKSHSNDPHVQFLLARAYTKAKRYNEGFSLAKKSCGSGDLGGCTLLGGYYNHGLYHKSYDQKKAIMLWQWSCGLGDQQGCVNLAMKIDDHRSYVPKHSKSKEEYLLEACISDFYPQACVVYANHLYFKTIEYDKELNEYTNYKGCISGDSNSCLFLDELLKKNKDPLKKEKYFFSMNASCKNGNAKACRRIGTIFNKSGKSPVNKLLALTRYEEGCRNGDERFSCWYAGRYRIARIEGIVQDIPLGIKYFEKACYIGMNTFACYDLAKFYLYTEEAGYKDKDKAIKPLERACKIGNVRALYLGCDQGIEVCCKVKQKHQASKNK